MSFKLSLPVQISLSTAEDSANYFTGDASGLHQPDLTKSMPAGTYRIIDDQLFQIIEAPRPQRNQQKED